MHLSRIFLIMLLFCCSSRASFGQDRFTGWCDSLEQADSSDLVEFLNGVVPDEKNARCVTWAVHRLGNEHYEPAIPALVKLLDFLRPLTDLEKTGMFIGMSGMEEMFSAAEALETIGKSAETEVLHAIGSDTASAAIREHALAVFMEIHKYERPHGIVLLKQQESKSDTEASKQKYKIAAQSALKFCIGDPEQPACETAAKTGHI
jgi:hypothetical protein